MESPGSLEVECFACVRRQCEAHFPPARQLLDARHHIDARHRASLHCYLCTPQQQRPLTLQPHMQYPALCEPASPPAVFVFLVPVLLRCPTSTCTVLLCCPNIHQHLHLHTHAHACMPCKHVPGAVCVAPRHAHEGQVAHTSATVAQQQTASTYYSLAISHAWVVPPWTLSLKMLLSAGSCCPMPSISTVL